MITQIGTTLKAIAFCLLCTAILEKIELIVVISMVFYGIGTLLIDTGIAEIQSDVEKNKDDIEVIKNTVR